eukprot:jgi/Tetstr1/422947/TSEL_013726.t1
MAALATINATRPLSSVASRGGAPLRANRRAGALRQPRRQAAHAGMGLGFTDLNDPQRAAGRPAKPVCDAEFGLTDRQIAALGINDAGFSSMPVPKAEALRAKAFYVGDDITENTRIATKMSGAAPGQAPPDLPSLLLDGRICYIGMPLVPSVTELIISELLWLNYNNPEKPVYLYINSIGSQTPMNEAVGFDTEAYAILDTMGYIRPEVHTLCVGQAFGNAAMLLASGKKGCRFALPNSRIMTAPPRMNRTGGNTANVMIKANELEHSTKTYTELLSRFTGREKEEVRKDIGRNRYFTPEQAIEYGLVDRIVRPTDNVAIEERNYEQMLAQSQSQRR